MSEKKNENQTENLNSEYSLVEIPASYGLGIQTPEGKVLSSEQGIVEILNKLNEIQLFLMK